MRRTHRSSGEDRRSLIVGMIAAVGILLGFCASSGVLAAGAEETSVLETLETKAPAPGELDRTPILMPATPAGWQGEVREPWDVAPYLAFHKALAFGGDKDAQDQPTPNQSLYDVDYYELVFDLDPGSHLLTGTTTVKATVLTGPLTEIELDLYDNMTVSAVTSGGVGAAFTHTSNDILTITLDRSYSTGEQVTLVIDYSGTPVGGSFGFEPVGGETLIWTLSEPYGARTWFPCKDYPYDKAEAVDIKVTVPTGMITASNGKLMEQTDDGTTAYSWWHEDHPITTYLISLAIYPYSVTHDTYVTAMGDSVDLVFYDFPDNQASNWQTNSKVKDMMSVYAEHYGEYPFPEEKNGNAEFTWGGGMEHQTCASIGFYGEWLVAHEVSHQWFGDNITCKTFNHVWLNEGFATYSEALWSEMTYGEEAYWADILANQYFGGGTIYVPDTNDHGRIFHSGLSYNKASWVLHMLRHIVGDDTFFDILRAYTAQYADSVADTEDFKNLCESMSGMQLDDFFDEWIYGEYYPIYSYDWTSQSAATSGWDVTLDVSQVQEWQLFTMPIDVKITTTAGEENFVIQNSEALEQYVLNVQDEPLDVALDSNHWILRIVNAPLPNPTFSKSLLLVNGVDWEVYGSEIFTAYEDEAFWAGNPIDFWDWFDEPAGGYPASLPEPLGHGTIPSNVIGDYQNIIWVGNNYNGDITGWFDAPILAYLQAGGNVLLMTRMGEDFISAPFEAYLGIDFLGTGNVYDCIAVEPPFTDIGRIGQQSYTSTFDQNVDPESVLLYQAVSGFNPPRGLGVIAIPPAGGEHNPDGARFAFLSGRPYRWDHGDLAVNVDRILDLYFGLDTTDAPDPAGALRFALLQARPNPFSSDTVLRFSLPKEDHARLRIYDLSGRLVRVLLDGPADAGPNTAYWDGRGLSGDPVAGGIYFYKLEAGGKTAHNKIIRLQ